jgi:hypothetical protein
MRHNRDARRGTSRDRGRRSIARRQHSQPLNAARCGFSAIVRRKAISYP